MRVRCSLFFFSFVLVNCAQCIYSIQQIDSVNSSLNSSRSISALNLEKILVGIVFTVVGMCYTDWVELVSTDKK